MTNQPMHQPTMRNICISTVSTGDYVSDASKNNDKSFTILAVFSLDDTFQMMVDF